MTRAVTASTPRAQRSLRASLLLLLALALLSVSAPLITPYDPNVTIDMSALKNRSPSMSHPFGTDSYSRDVLSRVMDGSRVTLTLAISAVALTLLVGTGFGAIAAFSGDAVDSLLMRLLDVLLGVPRLLVLLAITALWDGLSLVALILLIGCTGWYDVARLVRGEIRALLGRDFITAARASGIGSVRIFRHHLLPHLLPVLAVSATFGVANTIALEAGLSYLGLGVQPPQASWGTIMGDGAGMIDGQWWLTVFPGLAVILTILACNALGDALRDAFAPEQVPA